MFWTIHSVFYLSFFNSHNGCASLNMVFKLLLLETIITIHNWFLRCFWFPIQVSTRNIYYVYIYVVRNHQIRAYSKFSQFQRCKVLDGVRKKKSIAWSLIRLGFIRRKKISQSVTIQTIYWWSWWGWWRCQWPLASRTWWQFAASSIYQSNSSWKTHKAIQTQKKRGWYYIYYSRFLQ